MACIGIYVINALTIPPINKSNVPKAIYYLVV